VFVASLSSFVAHLDFDALSTFDLAFGQIGPHGDAHFISELGRPQIVGAHAILLV